MAGESTTGAEDGVKTEGGLGCCIICTLVAGCGGTRRTAGWSRRRAPVAYEVTSLGVLVVGTSGIHAVRWDSENGMRRLRDLLAPESCGWGLLEAMDVSNAGHIVGRGISPDAKERAYLASVGGLNSLWLCTGRGARDARAASSHLGGE